MEKTLKKLEEKETTEGEALEIIELAINDLDVLRRAFSTITDAFGALANLSQEEHSEEEFTTELYH